MKNMVIILVTLFCTATFAQKNVAVLEIERHPDVLNEISRSEAMEITNAIRSAAVRTLPRAQYSVMTTETVQAMGDAVLADCAGENCIITIGRRIDAEYIVRGTLNKFQTRFTLHIEMYETEYGNLIATADPIRSANLEEILDKSGPACVDMYRTFVSAGTQTTVSPPIVSANTYSQPPAAVHQPTVGDIDGINMVGNISQIVGDIVNQTVGKRFGQTVGDAVSKIVIEQVNTELSKLGNNISANDNIGEIVGKIVAQVVTQEVAQRVPGPAGKMGGERVGKAVGASVGRAVNDIISGNTPSLETKPAVSQVKHVDSASNVWAGALPGTVSSGSSGHTGAFILNSATYSGITNPAFIYEENYMSARFLFTQMLDGKYQIETGFTMPIGIQNAVGLSWIRPSSSSFEATNPEGVGLGQNIEDNTNYFAVSYARNVWSGLTVAANANLIMQNVADVSDYYFNVSNEMTTGFGMDIGLTYKLRRHPLLGSHILGLSMNNIFNFMLDSDEQQVSVLRLSHRSDLWNSRIYFGNDFVIMDLFSNDDIFDERGKYLPWGFTQKLGVNVLRYFKLYALYGISSEGFDQYGLALGVNMAKHFNDRDVEGLIQFVSKTGESDATHLTFSVRAEFGKHRYTRYKNKTAHMW